MKNVDWQVYHIIYHHVLFLKFDWYAPYVHIHLYIELIIIIDRYLYQHILLLNRVFEVKLTK